MPSIQLSCDIRPIAVESTQRPVRDAAAEHGVLAELFVDMQRIVIADQTRKQRDVAFADGPAAGALRDVDFEIFEIQAQRHVPSFRAPGETVVWLAN